MKLIIEKHLNLLNVLTRLKSWNIDFNIEYVENIQNKPFEISVSSDKEWSIIMPKENVGFVYDYNLHKDATKRYAGGAFLNRFSIIVYGNETDEILKLRIVHEWLHSIGKPADDLKKHIPKFLNWWERLLWNFKIVLINEQNPYWQRKYYKWLLKTEL